MKKFVVYLSAAILGGAVSLGSYKLLEPSTNYNSIGNNYSKVAGYEFKSITVPTFDFADVSQAVTPAVVHIMVKSQSEADNSYKRQPNDPFGDFFGEIQPRNQGPIQSSGSGVIIDDKGYIVTNNHVVQDATEIEVVLNDKRSFKADVVGKDPNTDLALIKIQADGLTAINVGNSDGVRVGEWSLAIGNPFNLTSTVTAGIISAKGRNIRLLGGNTAIESFIQTDAAVNPGNSGGALVNAKGELIGINTAIASQTGSYAGYSFAVPSNLMKKVIKDFREFGEVQRGFIGVQIKDVDAEIAREKGLSSTKGVLVEAVTDNGAAEKAGIKKGDVIMKVESKETNTVPELQEYVASKRPGDLIQVLVIREGKEKDFSLQLRNKDGKIGAVTSIDNSIRKALGADFSLANESEKSKFKIGNGVKVGKIENGALKSAGVPEGFIITSVDKTGVYSTNDIYKLLNGKKGAVVVEGYLPKGEHKYFLLELN